MSDSNTVPTFMSTENGMRVAHREFLTNVTGSVDFIIRDFFQINPGLSETFPWLSTVADCFELYRLHGLVFEYRPTSSAIGGTNPALGAVVLATQYDVFEPPFASKQEAESYQFSTSIVPASQGIHPVECANHQNIVEVLKVRSGAVPQGATPQLYDRGITSLCVAGMQSAYVTGELWISYDVEFLRPRLIAGGGSGYAKFDNQTAIATATLPFAGVSYRNGYGMTDITIADTGFIYFTKPGRYLCSLDFSSATTVTSLPTIITSVNASLYPYFRNNTVTNVTFIQTTTAKTDFVVNIMQSGAYVAIGGMVGLTAGWCDVNITRIPPPVTSISSLMESIRSKNFSHRDAPPPPPVPNNTPRPKRREIRDIEDME